MSMDVTPAIYSEFRIPGISSPPGLLCVAAELSVKSLVNYQQTEAYCFGSTN